MNATKEMLSAPVFDKTAGIMEALLAGKISNPQLLKGLSEGLVASKLPLKNLAISGGVGALAGETSRRLIPTIASKNPKRAKALSSLVGGVFGGIPGLAASLAASNIPAISKAKTLDAYRRLGLATTAGLGAELSLAPMLQQHGSKFLDPEVVKGLGNYATTTPKTIAGLAGGSLLTRGSLQRLGLGKHISPKKGGGVLLDTGLGLMASGSPVLGATTLLAAPLKNTKARKFVKDVVKELGRNREIEQLYKKSSYSDNSIKLAAPVYLTKPEYILDAPSLEKVGFIGNLARQTGAKIVGGLGKVFGGQANVMKGQKALSKTIQQQGFKPTEFLNTKLVGGGTTTKAPNFIDTVKGHFYGVAPEQVSNVKMYKNIGKGNAQAGTTFENIKKTKSQLEPQVLQQRTQDAQQALQQRATDQAAAAAKAKADVTTQQATMAQNQALVSSEAKRRTKAYGNLHPDDRAEALGYRYQELPGRGRNPTTGSVQSEFQKIYNAPDAAANQNLNALLQAEKASTLTPQQQQVLNYIRNQKGIANTPTNTFIQTTQGGRRAYNLAGNVTLAQAQSAGINQTTINQIQQLASKENVALNTLDDAYKFIQDQATRNPQNNQIQSLNNFFKNRVQTTSTQTFDRAAIEKQIRGIRSELDASIKQRAQRDVGKAQITARGAQSRLTAATSAEAQATQQAARRGEELTMMAPRTFETVGSKVTGVSRNTTELTGAVQKAEQELKQIDDLIAASGGTPTKQLQEARAKAVSNLQSQRAELVSGAGSGTSKLTAPIDSKLTAPLTAQRTRALETRISDIQKQVTNRNALAQKLRADAKKTGISATEKTKLRQRAVALENSAKELEAQVPQFQAQLQAQGRGIIKKDIQTAVKGQNRQELANLRVDELQNITTGPRATAIDSEITAAEGALNSIAPGNTFAKAQAKANLAALKSEKQYITKAEKALVEKQTGGAFAPASSVKTTAEANSVLIDINNQITALAGIVSPTKAETRRLKDLEKLKNAYAERAVKVNTDKVDLTNQLTNTQTQIEAKKAIISDPKVTSTAADAAEAEIKNLTKDKTLVENRLNELARIEQEGVLAGQTKARTEFMSAPVQAPGSARELKSTTFNTSAPERVSTESGNLGFFNTGASAGLKGTSPAESNFIANNDLLPAGYSEAMSGVFGRQKGSLLTGRTEARQVMKDSGLGKELGKSETVAKESIPGFRIGVPTEFDRTAEKLVQNFLTNNKATQQEILAQADKMGPEVKNLVDAALKNPAVTKQKQAIITASDNFARRMEGKVSVGLAERSDKITSSINKALSSTSKKYKNLSEASRQEASNIVTSINKAGLNGTPEGTAVLSLVDDALKSNNPKEVERAIESMSQLLQGKPVEVTTLGASKDWVKTFGRIFGAGSRKGTITFSPKSIQKLENLGVKTKPAIELDLKKNFTADNLGRIERHFEAGSPTVQKLKDLEKYDSGPAIMNKVLTGEARVADFTNKELEILGVAQEFTTTSKHYNAVSKGGKDSFTKTLDNIQSKIDSNLNKIKKKGSKKKPALSSAEKKKLQRENTELETLRTEITTHTNNAKAGLEDLNREVSGARQKYLEQDVGSMLFVPDEIKAEGLKQIQSRGFGGARGVAAGTAGVGGAAYLGAGSPETTQYFQAPVQQQQPMQGAASYLSSPLAAPVIRNKVAKMQGFPKPLKFKPNDFMQPPVIKMKDMPIESPYTSSYLSSMLQAPVGG